MKRTKKENERKYEKVEWPEYYPKTSLEFILYGLYYANSAK